MLVAANLAVEDELSEAIVRRLLSESSREYHVRAVYSRGGFGHIRKNISRYNVAARHTPFIVMTDLDNRYECPTELIEDWLSDPVERNLLFRVAVREPEAWILADSTAVSRLLGISAAIIPQSPETLADPKLTLLRLADRSPLAGVRESLVRAENGNFKQGPDYNGVLSAFVWSGWSPTRASRKCPSLSRMCRRLNEFVPQLDPST
jgi:hypothetical protein